MTSGIALNIGPAFGLLSIELQNGISFLLGMNSVIFSTPCAMPMKNSSNHQTSKLSFKPDYLDELLIVLVMSMALDKQSVDTNVSRAVQSSIEKLVDLPRLDKKPRSTQPLQ